MHVSLLGDSCPSASLSSGELHAERAVMFQCDAVFCATNET